MTLIQTIQLFFTLFFGGILLLSISNAISSLVDIIHFLISRKTRNILNEFLGLTGNLCVICAVVYIIWIINYGFICSCPLTIEQHIALAFIPLILGWILGKLIDNEYKESKNKDLLEKIAKMSQKK